MTALDDLVATLDDANTASTTTSVRQPTSLRRALHIAVELGMAPTANDATNQALRASLDVFALNLALEEHFAAHPQARPSLHEIAQALAVVDRSPLAERPDLLRRAEKDVLKHRPDADAEDVLLWALSLLDREQSSVSA